MKKLISVLAFVSVVTLFSSCSDEGEVIYPDVSIEDSMVATGGGGTVPAPPKPPMASDF